MRLSTDYPKNYMIGYDDFDELMSDYMKVSSQMEFIKRYTEKLDYEVGIDVGEKDYVLNVTIWKT